MFFWYYLLSLVDAICMLMCIYLYCLLVSFTWLCVLFSYFLCYLHAYLYYAYYVLMLFTCLFELFLLLVGVVYMAACIICIWFYDIYMLVCIMFITC